MNDRPTELRRCSRCEHAYRFYVERRLADRSGVGNPAACPECGCWEYRLLARAVTERKVR